MANIIDKTSSKYIIALKFVNNILKNLDKSEINDLTDFKDIDREDIIKTENKELVETMQSELFKKGNFDKGKCGFYRRSQVKTYILTLLRYICLDLGFKFTYTEKRIQKNTIAKSYYHYNITN